MARISVIIEVPESRDSAFARHSEAIESVRESLRLGESLAARLGGYGLELVDAAPIPLFGSRIVEGQLASLAEFASPIENDDLTATSYALSAEVDESILKDLQSRTDISVWPNSTITFFEASSPNADELGLDCRPHRPGVPVELIQQRLGVERVWQSGFRGDGVMIGVVDDGINGQVYPVAGGFSGIGGQVPGGAAITSHGSMAAADVLVAAPAVRFLDYSFLAMPNSVGLSNVLQVILNQRRINGTPHITSNSYGFVERPSRSNFPNHEVWNIRHPVHQKVAELVMSGAAAFYAAGNCGADCPFPDCQPSGTGPGSSINAFNSLAEVITVAAVNSRHERLGYSAQGPGGFEPRKPDISAYSHFFANYGPARPAGLSQPFDSGTSASAPLAAGVGALLLSAFPRLTPAEMKRALISSAISLGPPGWNSLTGFGVINAAAAFDLISE